MTTMVIFTGGYEKDIDLEAPDTGAATALLSFLKKPNIIPFLLFIILFIILFMNAYFIIITSNLICFSETYVYKKTLQSTYLITKVMPRRVIPKDDTAVAPVDGEFCPPGLFPRFHPSRTASPAPTSCPYQK